MKKIGEYTAKGNIAVSDTGGESKKIQLFDGRFDTGYRVREFIVMTNDPMFNNLEFTAKLTTRENNDRKFNWQQNDQIAWAFGEDTVWLKGIVDPENMVIEDLFIYAAINTTSDVNINYMIVMDKYEISDWQGALAMATERADP
tara:strand:+ start:186 stop:617 length:432 start_codon:yes stop_codon:yes gene_type:complete